MDETTRLKARELLLRSRIYRFMAMIFAAIGLIVFMYLYFEYIDGDIFQAFQDISLVVIVLVPFLPAFVLSRMASKAEKEFMGILETLPDKEKKPDGKEKG